ncbi:hypothetical protein D3C73_1626790 [compost metagenome]
MIDEISTQGWAKYAGEAENGGHQAHPFTALTRREQVADGSKGSRLDDTGPDPLNPPVGNELEDV